MEASGGPVLSTSQLGLRRVSKKLLTISPQCNPFRSLYHPTVCINMVAERMVDPF